MTDTSMQAPTTVGALPRPVRDLIAAIVEALDLPLPSIDDADERAHYSLLQRRTIDVRIHLETMLDFPDVDITRDASEVRARTAAMPVDYGLYEQQATAEEPTMAETATVDEVEAVRRSVDRAFPAVARFLNGEASEGR